MSDNAREQTASILELSAEKASRLTRQDAETYYTWANLFQALAADAGGETRQKYFHVKDIVNEERDCKRCDDWKQELFRSSPSIRFLSEQISTVGPPLLPSHIRCRRCPTIVSQTAPGIGIGGGFNVDYGILICANQMKSRSHLEDTLAHEMVHAWDHLKFHVQPDNMRHQACTEIRAATLSGECRMGKEVWGRGQWGVVMGMQECVRRRAVLSMLGRPQIQAKGAGAKEEATRVVNDVFEGCFRDTRPFDEIFR